MGATAWQTTILLLLALSGRFSHASPTSVRVPMCPLDSIVEAVLGFRDLNCPLNHASIDFPKFTGRIEGDESTLQKALTMVYKNTNQYVAVLLYASWCPFSRSFRLTFSAVSSWYPSIPHFAIEESSIRPSVLSKYGVHGFPTLLLLNSTMRVRYHGLRNLDPLLNFYSDFTGIKAASLEKISRDKTGDRSDQENPNSTEPETCPFPWARFPENLLREETYLALATTFLLLRLLYFLYPTLLVLAQFTRRRFVNLRFGNLLDHPLAYLKRVQLFSYPRRRSNLQGGAMNARAWASKSLATVSIGDASSS